MASREALHFSLSPLGRGRGEGWVLAAALIETKVLARARMESRWRLADVGLAVSLRRAPHPGPLPGGERGMTGEAKIEQRARGAAAAFRWCAFAPALDPPGPLGAGGEGWTIRPRRGRGQESSPF